MDLESRAIAALEAKENTDGDTNKGEQQNDSKGDDHTKDTPKDGADASKKAESSDDSKSDEDANASEADNGDDDIPGLDVEALPERARYIYDNLPTLTARGVIDGKSKDFQVKTAQELPDKFEFASKRDELLFVQELADQSGRATALDTKWQQQDQQVKFDTWQAEQAKDIASDLKDLQKENLVPKFTDKEAKENPDDPGVKLANDIYEYMQKTNTARANAGKPYFLSYRDAAEIVLAKKGLETKNQDNSKIQEERTKVATKVSSGQGTARELKKPVKYKSVMDIVDAHYQDLN